MFLSVRQLDRDMGVDPRIGRFFVDRRVPQHNRFWKGRLLYISFGNGFTNIPVFYDLLFRIGVPLESLIAEKHIVFMEQLMHYAMQQEFEEITRQEELVSVRALLNGRVTNQDRFEKLNEYLDQPVSLPLHGFGTDWPALNRADLFLYILCDLPLTGAQWSAALEAWYALHPTYLLMDDIRDYESDRDSGQENIVIGWGGGKEGFQRAIEEIEVNNKVLDRFNPVLAGFLRSTPLLQYVESD